MITAQITFCYGFELYTCVLKVPIRHCMIIACPEFQVVHEYSHNCIVFVPDKGCNFELYLCTIE